MAEIFDIANKELRPDADDEIEGPLDDQTGRWRRGVRVSALAQYRLFDLDDVDEYRLQACDYVLVYRNLTENEQIDLKAQGGWVITSVRSNDDLGKLITSRTRLSS